jgi:hypothetical protein
MSRKHLPAAVLVAIGCSVALRTDLDLNSPDLQDLRPGAPITSALSITSLHWRRPDRHPPMGYGLDPGGHLPPPLKDNWSAIDCILLALDRDLASARLRMIETGWG